MLLKKIIRTKTKQRMDRMVIRHDDDVDSDDADYDDVDNAPDDG